MGLERLLDLLYFVLNIINLCQLFKVKIFSAFVHFLNEVRNINFLTFLVRLGFKARFTNTTRKRSADPILEIIPAKLDCQKMGVVNNFLCVFSKHITHFDCKTSLIFIVCLRLL